MSQTQIKLNSQTEVENNEEEGSNTESEPIFGGFQCLHMFKVTKMKKLINKLLKNPEK